MPKTTVSTKCTAQNRATCRYHGALQHASINLAEAQQSYDEAVVNHEKTVAENGSEGNILQARNRVTNRKRVLNRAQQEYDAETAPYKELKNFFAGSQRCA